MSEWEKLSSSTEDISDKEIEVLYTKAELLEAKIDLIALDNGVEF